MRQGFHTSRTETQKHSDWYVSDGARVVGPIGTQKLLVEAARGSVDPGHVVCQSAWGFWKPLHLVREFRAMKNAQRLRGGAWVPPPAWSPRLAARVELARAMQPIDVARDRDEVLHLALRAAASSTGATVGLVHRPRFVGGPLHTRAALGASVMDRLGERVASIDPALFAARSLGPILIQNPTTSRAGIASTLRLSRGYTPLLGVALFPLFVDQKLAGIVELGNENHDFRRDDIRSLEAVVKAASARLSGWSVS